MKRHVISIAWLVASTSLSLADAVSTSPPLSDPEKARNHWAFKPVKDPAIPTVENKDWVQTPVDAFVLAKLESKKLTPSPPADKRTLIRRATYDLTGLPPTPEEVSAFLADESAEAFAKVVDRLLASPGYGERWGRHWMDVVRYADTAGDNADYPIPEVRLYRDYIIESFNSDKPYAQFVQEQLAGDILAKQGSPESHAERVIATGFIALSRRYATAPFELWHLTLEDTIDTTGRAFMGLTLRCARCHDHKYDPVTKEDYYALYGFFASTHYPYAGSEEFQSKSFPRSGFVPLKPLVQADSTLKLHEETIEKLKAELTQKQVAALKGQIEAKQKEIAILESRTNSTDEAKAKLAALEKQNEEIGKTLQDQLKSLRAELSKLERPGLPPGLAGAYAVSEGQPADAHVQARGNPEDKGPIVPRRPPQFLADGAAFAIPKGCSGRLQFAQWLTRPENPLTARVMVNRIWQHHFGKGIVGTPSNFGLRGEEPTHPELLDFLAARFVESGWSIKALHRLIMLSGAYQLASADVAASAAKDPGNKWCWRFDRRRLDAESIRDGMLFAAGKLDLRRPGAHSFPPIASWTYTQHAPFKAVYESNHRSVYLMTQRIQRHPYLALFDGPDPNTTSDVRTESTVALQALFLTNNHFVREQAAALAQRLIAASSAPRERICLACELAWSRPPREEEVEKAIAFVQQYQQELDQAGAAKELQELEAWTSYAQVLVTANEFVYID